MIVGSHFYLDGATRITCQLLAEDGTFATVRFRIAIRGMRTFMTEVMMTSAADIAGANHLFGIPYAGY